MKCFVWTDEVTYTAFAVCESVTEARRLLRDEIGGYDGSCPERKKAREAVEEMTPAIYVGRIAGFRLSDSAEVRELEQYQDKLTAERDQLRAELAAAKGLLARIHRDGGHHTEAVGVARSIADADNKVSEWLLAADERNALAADNARLRKALEWSKSYWPEREESRHCADCCCPVCDVNACIDEAELALAATPAQSLAAHDAALLREVADREFNPEQSAEERWAHGVLHGNADRMEQEAQRG